MYHPDISQQQGKAGAFREGGFSSAVMPTRKASAVERDQSRPQAAALRHHDPKVWLPLNQGQDRTTLLQKEPKLCWTSRSRSLSAKPFAYDGSVDQQR